MTVINIHALKHTQANSPALSGDCLHLCMVFFCSLLDACIARAKRCCLEETRESALSAVMPADNRSEGNESQSTEMNTPSSDAPNDLDLDHASSHSSDERSVHGAENEMTSTSSGRDVATRGFSLMPSCSLQATSLELSGLLPAAWVWTCYLMENWSDLLLDGKYPQPWSRLCDLLNIIVSWKPVSGPESFADCVTAIRSEHSELLSLPEDQLVAGFSPIHKSLKFALLCMKTGNNSSTFSHLSARARRLVQCCQQLTKSAPACGLRCEEHDGNVHFTFSSMKEVIDDIPGNASPSNTNMEVEGSKTGDSSNQSDSGDEESEDEDVIVVEEFEESLSEGEAVSEDVAISDPIQQLKARKDTLQQQLLAQQHYQEKVQEVMAEEAGAPQVELLIAPRYLVPDTNCFIRFLPQLCWLLDCNRFTLAIPLVVANELEGLKKGVRDGEEGEHEEEVESGARAALEFLEERFAAKHRFLRGVTSKGSLMNTIAFRNEEPTGRLGNNDDTILNCAVLLSDHGQAKLDTKRNVQQIACKTVLLTNDRNLRVKAHARHIPTRDVGSFIQWLKT